MNLMGDPDARRWIEVVLAPTALFGWFLLAVLVVQWRRCRAGVARAAVFLATLTYFLCTMPDTADVPLARLEARARTLQARCPAPPSGSLFIVLAGGLARDPTSADDFAALGVASLRRQIEATALAARTPDSHMLISGGDGDRWREADLMAAFATRLGFAPSRLIVDTVSRTTMDSARMLAAREARLPPGPRYVVTSAVHIPRAMLALRRAGIDACAWPVDFAPRAQDDNTGLIPQEAAFAHLGAAWHELLGMVYYRVAGLRAATVPTDSTRNP